MIPNFFNTVQEDLIRIVEYGKNKTDTKDQDQKVDQDKKVWLSAQRVLGASGMAVAIVVGAAAFTASTPVGGLFVLATAVAIYAVSHDAFVIGVNKEKAMIISDVGKKIIEAAPVVGNIFAQIGDWWKGSKNLVDDAYQDVAIHVITEGTFFQPIWKAILKA